MLLAGSAVTFEWNNGKKFATYSTDFIGDKFHKYMFEKSQTSAKPNLKRGD